MARIISIGIGLNTYISQWEYRMATRIVFTRTLVFHSRVHGRQILIPLVTYSSGALIFMVRLGSFWRTKRSGLAFFMRRRHLSVLTAISTPRELGSAISSDARQIMPSFDVTNAKRGIFLPGNILFRQYNGNGANLVRTVG